MIYAALLMACIALVGVLLMVLQTVLATAIAQPPLTVCKIYWLPTQNPSNSDIKTQPYLKSLAKKPTSGHNVPSNVA